MTKRTPSYQAGDCKGQTKKGKDRLYVSKPGKKGICKWTPLSRKTKKASKKDIHYDTHNNGGKSFRVYVDGQNVSVYKLDYDQADDSYKEGKLIKTLRVNEVYVGKSNGGAHTPAQARKFIGNSILLHVSGNKYVFVGTECYEFEMEDEVDQFFSLVGNNDFPYPVLLGTENVYFMLESEHNYIPRSYFSAIHNEAQWENAYAYYYGWLDAKTGAKASGFNPTSAAAHAKKMKKFHMIQRRT